MSRYLDIARHSRATVIDEQGNATDKMVADPHGDWVLFNDHRDAVAAFTRPPDVAQREMFRLVGQHIFQLESIVSIEGSAMVNVFEVMELLSKIRKGEVK